MKNLSSPSSVLKQIEENKELNSLYKKAAFSKDQSRLFQSHEKYETSYKSDVDKIIHSKAYTRYVDKTQVIYLIENDHITNRGLHVQLVSHFARGIAKTLKLNVDLVEAISLGHDVGHPPFGHEGEGYLNELSLEFSAQAFTHPWQSCRLFTHIEPLNLNLNVYDGFLCHDGGLCGNECHPKFNKTWKDHFQECQQKLHNPDSNIWPGTLEGCLVKLCDTISYLVRDIEDAISIGIISRKDIPKTFLEGSNRAILNILSEDIITQSYEKDYIALSKESYESLLVLRKFNFENIYMHKKLKLESSRIKRGYRILFEYLLNDLKKEGSLSYIDLHFLKNKSEKYLQETTHVQKVIDYLSGMTDHYFVRTLEKIMIPKQIEWT